MNQSLCASEVRDACSVAPRAALTQKGNDMLLVLLVLLLALVLGGLGFAAHVLWIVAAVVFVFWLIGFAVARGENAGSGSGRWYRW